jgi:hypothetical protein
MRKVLLVCAVAMILLAISAKPGDLTSITGFLIQTGSVLITIARSIIKQILSLAIKVL